MPPIRKPSLLKPAAKFTVAEFLALRARLESGLASPAEAEMVPRVLAYFRAKYAAGNLSARTAEQLGLSA